MQSEMPAKLLIEVRLAIQAIVTSLFNLFL